MHLSAVLSRDVARSFPKGSIDCHLHHYITIARLDQVLARRKKRRNTCSATIRY